MKITSDMQDVLRFGTEMILTNPRLHLASSIVKRDTWGNNKNVSNNPVAPLLDYFWHQVAQTLSGGCQLVFTSSDITMVQTCIYNNVTIQADYKTFAPLLAAPYLCRRIRAMMRSGSLEITFTSVFRRKNIKHRYILYQAAIDHQHWNRTEYWTICFREVRILQDAWG